MTEEEIYQQAIANLRLKAQSAWWNCNTTNTNTAPLTLESFNKGMQALKQDSPRSLLPLIQSQYEQMMATDAIKLLLSIDAREQDKHTEPLKDSSQDQ